MAILKEGIHGGFSGKAGSVVGYCRLGKWVVRSLPKKSQKNKLGTAAQKERRNQFTEMQHFLKPILEYIRVGFNKEARTRQMTAHNVAKSYNMRHAFAGDGTIDCAKVLISYGDLPGAPDVSVMQTISGFQITWTNSTEENKSRADDQVILLAYDTALGQVYGTRSGARRINGHEEILIPQEGRGTNYHIWMAFIAENREKISTSSYLGNFECQYFLS